MTKCAKDSGHYPLTSTTLVGKGRQKALLTHLGKPAQACVSVPMQLLGIGKTALYRFLASLINPLAPGAEPVGCDLFKAVLPDMACHNLGVIAALRTGIAQRTAFADPRAAFIFPVSGCLVVL